MTTVSVFKRRLSGSTDGMPIKVAATESPGTLIHTAQTGTTDGNYDEIWLYAYNGHTGAVILTIEFGGVTAPDQTIKTALSSNMCLVLVVPGLILQNSKEVRAFSDVANVATISGFVNKITEA